MLVELARPRTSALTVARTILEPVLAPLETTFIVLIVAVFILMQKEDLRDRFIRVFGSTDLHRTTLALDDAGERLSRFFIAQLGINASFGLVIGLGLWAIGIPTPALWGGLAGLLRFVPYIGPLLGVVAPLALARRDRSRLVDGGVGGAPVRRRRAAHRPTSSSRCSTGIRPACRRRR